MKSIISLASILVVCLSANAQNWNCDTLININKTTNHIQIHTYGNLYNIDDANIEMTYMAHFQNIPEGWQFTLDDPTNDYTEVIDGGSANFMLSEGVDPLYPQKMIFGMNHNGIPGHGQLIYNIHSNSNPTDSIKMVFNIVISPGTPLATEDRELDRAFYYAGQGHFHLPDNVESITLWNLNGKLISRTENSNLAQKIKLKTGNNSIVLAEIKMVSRFYSKKFVIID